MNHSIIIIILLLPLVLAQNLQIITDNTNNDSKLNEYIRTDLNNKYDGHILHCSPNITFIENILDQISKKYIDNTYERKTIIIFDTYNNYYDDYNYKRVRQSNLLRKIKSRI